MSQAILDALHAKLVADQSAGTFYDDVGGRIYQGQGPNNVALPYCEFDSVGVEPEVFMDQGGTGPRTQTADVQIDLYGNTDDGPKALGDVEQKLYDLLEKASISPTGSDRGVVRCSIRMLRVVEEDAYRITDQFTIQATEF